MLRILMSAAAMVRQELSMVKNIRQQSRDDGILTEHILGIFVRVK